MKSSNSDFLREKLEGLQYVEVENRGEEFTEEIYKEFFMGSDLELIGAFADGKLVGIIGKVACRLFELINNEIELYYLDWFM